MEVFKQPLEKDLISASRLGYMMWCDVWSLMCGLMTQCDNNHKVRQTWYLPADLESSASFLIQLPFWDWMCHILLWIFEASNKGDNLTNLLKTWTSSSLSWNMVSGLCSNVSLTYLHHVTHYCCHLRYPIAPGFTHYWGHFTGTSGTPLHQVTLIETTPGTPLHQVPQ